MTRAVRVVLADDDPRFRDAAADALRSDADVDVVAVVDDGTQALRAAFEHRATVLCMDLGMPGGGTELVRAARDTGLNVLVLTADDRTGSCLELLRAGALCIVSKYGIDLDLSRAAVRCHNGDVVLVGEGPASVIDQLLSSTPR